MPYWQSLKIGKTRNTNLKVTGSYMHDQYQHELVEQREKLLPIMKRAKDDGKEAYIMYNKLIENVRNYIDGPYGRVGNCGE